MLKVKNQKVIRKISTRSLLANKKKNLIAVMAIMLTCILFTAVFSIGGSVIERRRQAVLLSLVGIPGGMILGTILAKILLTVILSTFLTYNVVFSLNPIIYVASVIFSFITVLMSCRKPCRLASKVSPIEALRYTEKSTVKKKTKKSRKVSAFTMAVENVKRSRKKVLVVVLSLSMSMILVNSIYNMVHSFDMESYISNSITGDFQVTHSSVMNLGASVKIYDGVSQEELAMFRELDGVEAVAAVYAGYAVSLLDEQGKQRVEEFVNSHERMKNDSWLMDELENGVKKEGHLIAGVYGIDRNAFEVLDTYGKDISWEEFNSGSYCLLYEEEDTEENWMFGEGDKITLQLEDGTIKEYEVLAVAKIPYSLSTRSYPALGISPILPEEEYLEHSLKNGVMNLSMTVCDDKAAEVESFYSYVIWPVLACAPVLVVLAALIPYGAYGQMSRDSIVERLKLIE